MARRIAGLAGVALICCGAWLLSSPAENVLPGEAPAGPPAASQPDGPSRVLYTHPATGFAFPARLGQFRCQKVTFFREDADIGVTYMLPERAEITVYVYPAPADAVGPVARPGQAEPDGPSPEFKRHFEECKDAIRKNKAYAHVSDGQTQVRFGEDRLVGCQALYSDSDNGVNSRLLLFKIKGHYLKVRLTVSADPDGPRVRLPLKELFTHLPADQRGLPAAAPPATGA